MKKNCCFSGHRDINDEEKVISVLKDKIEVLIINENVREFWVGNYGSFDSIAANCVRSLKIKYGDIKLILIILYVTKRINEFRKYYYDNYDGILIADVPISTPTKYKILKCNEYMVKQADYIICYVKYHWGGAYKTLEYAEK